MSGQVKVEDLEVFKVFRVAMLKFQQAASQALCNADAQISRTHSWLENEQSTYWHGALRKRMEMVSKARDAVRQKKLYRDSSGRMPDASEEEKHLKKCERAVEEAQEKIEAVKRALPRLEKEADAYRGQVTRLGRQLVDMPKAIALLDRLAMSLEAYLQIEAPSGGTSAEVATSDENMARGGEDVPPAAVMMGRPAQEEEQSAKPESAAEAPKQEAGDVADGK